MEKITRQFLWGSKEDHHALSLVAWPKVTTDKNGGGLGLREMKPVNNAFGIKLCWEIFSMKDKPWVQFLTTKYKFDNDVFFPPVAPSVCSPLWRLVCSNWETMASNVAWLLGDGRSTLFWEQCWVPGLSLPLINVCIRDPPDNLRFKVVSDFVNPSGSWQWSKIDRFVTPVTRQMIEAVLPPTQSAGSEHTRPDTNVYWKCPPAGVLKLNCDASATADSSAAYGGGVVRDHFGRWVGGYVSNLGRCPILRAEIWSILQGIDYALSLGVQKIQIESDNAIAVDMIEERAVLNASCAALILQIRGKLARFEEAHVSHTHREGNFVADCLSHYAYAYDPGVYDLDEPPDIVKFWLFHDVIGVSYTR